MMRVSSLVIAAFAVTAAGLTAAPAADAPRHPGAARGKLATIETATTPPVIDGDLVDWGDLTAHGVLLQQQTDHLSTQPIVPSIKPTDAAAVKLRSDDHALYVAIRVVDGAVRNPYPPLTYWQGDCVELYLDVRPVGRFKGGGQLADNKYSDGVYQLLLVPPTDGKPARWSSAQPQTPPPGPLDLAGKTLADGYTLELRIPFASLNGATAERLREPIGFNIQIDDIEQDIGPRDAAPHDVYCWGGLPESYLNPANFGCAWQGETPQPQPPVLRQTAALVNAATVRQTVFTRQDSIPRKVADLIQLRWQYASSPYDFPSGRSRGERPMVSDTTGTLRYPQLGFAAHSRELRFKKLPGGRYTIASRLAGAAETTQRFYVMAGTPYLQPVTPLVIPLEQALGTAWPDIELDNAYPAARDDITVTTPLYPEANLWWQFSEQAASGNAAAIPHVQLNVSRQSDGAPAWSGATELRPTGTKFTIPAGRLGIGIYRAAAAVVLPDGKTISFAREGASVEPTLRVMPESNAVLHATLQRVSHVLRRAVLVGEPYRARFARDTGRDCVARSIWALHAYQGRIYAGAGDWDENRGPIDIWSFQPTNDNRPVVFEKEFTVDDEAIDRMRDYDGRLYVPGIDAHEPTAPREWDLGNLYIKADGQWTKRRTLPNAVHVLDAAVFNGKLYATGGTEKGAGFFESGDGGLTWTRTQVETLFRFYEMAPLDDRLILLPNDARNGAYQWQNGRLERLAAPVFPGVHTERYESGYRLQRLGNVLLYTLRNGEIAGNTTHYGYDVAGTRPLFCLRDFNGGAAVIDLFRHAQVRDIVVRDGRAYVLTSRDKGDRFAGEVYSSTDLEHWELVADFASPALPGSLEVMDGKFYVGLINRSYQHVDKAAGGIYRLAD